MYQKTILSKRTFANLLNPYAGPAPEGNTNYASQLWNGSTRPFIKAGTVWPDIHPSRVVKVSAPHGQYPGDDVCWMDVYATVTRELKFRGVQRFAPYGKLPNLISTEGYYGSRWKYDYDGSGYPKQPPWDEDKADLCIPTTEIRYYRGPYDDSIGRFWILYTQKMTSAGELEEYNEIERKEQDWLPTDEDGYAEWEIGVNYYTEEVEIAYYKEFGEDILPKDLGPSTQGGPASGPAGPMLRLRDAQHTDVAPFMLSADIDPIPEASLLAFKPQDDEFTWRWFYQEVRIEIWARPVNSCNRCWYDGKTYSGKVAYENGTCRAEKGGELNHFSIKHGADVTCEFGDADEQTESFSLTINAAMPDRYFDVSIPEYILGSFTWGFDEIDPEVARRVTDIYIDSIT